jgi:hypothetical protein
MVAVLAVVVASIAFYLFSGTESGGQGPKPGTTPGTVYVSNVEIERYLYEDEGLYMRLKISGEADLRGPVSINGVYGLCSAA